MACLWGVVSVEINGQELFSRSLFKQVFTARSLKKKKFYSITVGLHLRRRKSFSWDFGLFNQTVSYGRLWGKALCCYISLLDPTQRGKLIIWGGRVYFRWGSQSSLRSAEQWSACKSFQLWHMWLRWVKQQKMKEWSAQLSQKEVWRTQNVSNLWNDARVHTPGLMLNWRLALNAQLLSPYVCLYMNDLDILGRNRPHLVSFGTFCVCVFF